MESGVCQLFSISRPFPWTGLLRSKCSWRRVWLSKRVFDSDFSIFLNFEGKFASLLWIHDFVLFFFLYECCVLFGDVVGLSRFGLVLLF